jgi:hypothetical protein
MLFSLPGLPLLSERGPHRVRLQEKQHAWSLSDEQVIQACETMTRASRLYDEVEFEN